MWFLSIFCYICLSILTIDSACDTLTFVEGYSDKFHKLLILCYVSVLSMHIICELRLSNNCIPQVDAV